MAPEKGTSQKIRGEPTVCPNKLMHKSKRTNKATMNVIIGANPRTRLKFLRPKCTYCCLHCSTPSYPTLAQAPRKANQRHSSKRTYCMTIKSLYLYIYLYSIYMCQPWNQIEDLKVRVHSFQYSTQTILTKGRHTTPGKTQGTIAKKQYYFL